VQLLRIVQDSSEDRSLKRSREEENPSGVAGVYGVLGEAGRLKFAGLLTGVKKNKAHGQPSVGLVK
jgi:hypothetical protein